MMENCRTYIERLISDDPSEVREMCFRIGEDGCIEGIPHLVELLKHEDIGVQEAAELSLRKLGGERAVESLIPLLWEERPCIRNVVIDILRDIGSQGVDLLLDLLYEEDPDIRIFVVDILGHTGNVMVARALCEILLNDPDPNVKAQAAISLGMLGFLESVPCLEKALEDEEWVKFSAIDALKKIGSESSAEILINYLGKGSDLIDSAIIDALAQMGKVRIVPILINKLDTENVPLRNKVIQALVNLLGERTLEILDRGQRDKFKHYFFEALSDEDRDVQLAALRGLSYVKGEDAANAIFEYALTLDPENDEELLEEVENILKEIGVSDGLIEGARSKDEYRARLAIKILCQMEDDRAYEELTKIFWEQDRDFQREIALELSQKNHPLLKDFFLKVLKEHKDGKVIKCGLRFLGEKMKCEDAESEIIKFLDHPYDDVKEVALQAAISIGTESVKQEFMRMKKDEDPIKRFMAIYGFGSLGDKRFLADIKEAFCDEVEDVRKVAVEAYAQCADSDEEVLEVLSPMLEDGSRDVRLAVLDVLSHVKLRDKVRDLIIPLLKDKDDWVRIRAVEILGNIKEGVEPSILRPLLNSKNNLLRIKTLEALDNIGGEQVTRIFIDLLKTERDPEVQNTIERMLSKK
ncbi:HEAT repeat domain-containing protein [Desulfothermus okinawensis JCM 13304]